MIHEVEKSRTDYAGIRDKKAGKMLMRNETVLQKLAFRWLHSSMYTETGFLIFFFKINEFAQLMIPGGSFPRANFISISESGISEGCKIRFQSFVN